MWILASSQLTNSPSIQIFSTLSSGMQLSLNVLGAVVADLRRGAGDVDRLLARLGDAGGGVGLAQEFEHHRRRANGGEGVGLASADDVGRRAVHGLEHRRAGAKRVEVGRRGQT